MLSSQPGKCLYNKESLLWLEPSGVCVQADVARKIKEECEGELAVAMPILEDALAALDTIKEADIVYIRKLGNPPGAIKLVMEVSLLYRHFLARAACPAPFFH